MPWQKVLWDTLQNMPLVWITFDADVTEHICPQTCIVRHANKIIFVRLLTDDAYLVVTPSMIINLMYKTNPSLYEEYFMDIGDALQNMNNMLNNYFQLTTNRPKITHHKHIYAENECAYTYDNLSQNNMGTKYLTNLKMVYVDRRFEYHRTEKKLSSGLIKASIEKSCTDILAQHIVADSRAYGRIKLEDIPLICKKLLSVYLKSCTPIGIQGDAQSMPLIRIVSDYLGYVEIDYTRAEWNYDTRKYNRPITISNYPNHTLYEVYWEIQHVTVS